jgi:hypothetical protein
MFSVGLPGGRGFDPCEEHVAMIRKVRVARTEPRDTGAPGRRRAMGLDDSALSGYAVYRLPLKPREDRLGLGA